MSVKVYFISGLGANQSAFNLIDLSWCDPVFVQWHKPVPGQTLKSYALQLRQQIKEEHPIIVGVSFGGMLATEMAANDKNVKAIIISSNKCSAEFPIYLRMWKYLPVYKWVSPAVVTSLSKIIRPFMGPQGKAQKALFKNIMVEADPAFTIWAIDAILNWQSIGVPDNVVHIHGSGDRLLPARFAKPHHLIKGGRHIMIMDKATEISKLLQQLIITPAH